MRIKSIVFVGLILFLNKSVNADNTIIEGHGTGYTASPDRKYGVRYASFIEQNLPESYDLRDYGWVSPVVDQGSCGSCWAFGSTAAMEGSMLMFNPSDYKKLSEQHLVNCMFSGCGGGDFAHEWQKTKGQHFAEDIPYKARNGSCSTGAGKPVDAIFDFQRLGTSDREPDVQEIKTAIYRYGVVSTVVAAGGSGWGSGSGFGCRNRGINHLVALVGWTKDNKWIMKNSWGQDWGQGGYAELPFGCDRLGAEVEMVLYKGVPVDACLPPLLNLPPLIRADWFGFASAKTEKAANVKYRWLLDGETISEDRNSIIFRTKKPVSELTLEAYGKCGKTEIVSKVVR